MLPKGVVLSRRTPIGDVLPDTNSTCLVVLVGLVALSVTGGCVCTAPGVVVTKTD